MSDFSKVTMEASRQWSSALEVLRENYHKHRFLYPTQHSFNYEDRIKISLSLFYPKKFLKVLKKFISFLIPQEGIEGSEREVRHERDMQEKRRHET